MRHPFVWEVDDDVEIQLRGWLGLDFLTFPRTEAGYGLSRHANVGVREAVLSPRLEIGSDWSFRFDFDLADRDPVVQEAWGEYSPFPQLNVRAGRIRVPFGIFQEDFAFGDLELIGRPLVAGISKDLRDQGLMLHGRLWSDRLDYALAVVSGSRDIAVNVNETPDIAGRLRIAPFIGVSEYFEGLSLTASATYGDGPTRHGFRGQTNAEFSFADPPTIRGVQWRVAGGLRWDTLFWHLVAEVQRLDQQRDGVTASQLIGSQMVTVGDLDSYVISGWAIEASWHIFGSRAVERPITGLEVALRYENIDLSDGSRTVTTGQGTEDHAPLLDQRVDGLSASLNYYLGHRARLGVTWQGLWFSDPTTAPDYEAGTTGTTGTDDSSELVHHFFLRILTEI